MGTYHSGRNDVIETDDIQGLLGLHIGTEPDGTKSATLKVSLDPAKDWEAVKQFFLHVTNGVYPRMLGPVTPVDHPSELRTHAPVEPVSTSTDTESSTSTETPPESTEPAQESEATPTEPAATSTESTEQPTTGTEVTEETAPPTTTEG